MTKIETTPVGGAFGSLAPSPFQGRVRALARGLPYTYSGRKFASLLLGPAGGRTVRAYDVSIFETQKARLNPTDNICEKRVYLTPQHWDPAERAALAAVIAAHKEEAFYFFDIGANVGLYSLFARAAAMNAEKRLHAVCVEPDPEMRARAAFNVVASAADGDINLAPYAAAGENGPLRFSINKRNRGMSRVDEVGEATIEGRTLLALIEEASFPRIDAMKIDIEGHEFAALNAFFKSAPAPYWPRFVIMETFHERGEERASKLFEVRGYRLSLRTKLNSVFVYP